MSQQNPKNWPVALSYGQKGFLPVGSLTGQTGPHPAKRPPTPPPKTALSRFPGTSGTPNRVHWVRISHAIKLVGGHFAHSGPQDLGNPFLGVFGPEWGRAISFSPQHPQQQVNREFLEKTRLEPPNAVRVRKLRNTNAVQLSQTFPANGPVAPSYGQNEFWLHNRQNGSATTMDPPPWINQARRSL